MKNKWIALLACMVTFIPFSAIQAKAPKVGDYVGEALATDIAAYVNGAPIPSMNIEGYTAVTAEDLRSYGFDVAWSPTSRSLVIEPAAQKVQPVVKPNPAADRPIGTKFKDVLYTDIRTYYGDKPIPSYNIDGQTAIRLNDLAPFGTVDWTPEKRTISFQASPPPAKPANPLRQAGATLTVSSEKDINIKLQFTDDGEYQDGTKVGFPRNGLPFFQLAHFADQLGYTITTDGTNVTVSSGLYAFRLHPDSQEVELYWGDSWVKSYQLVFPPHRADDSLYLYSLDMGRLFGYTGTWNQEQRTLDVRYESYAVSDYGLPIKVDGETATVKAAATLPSDMPFGSAGELRLSLDNSHTFGNGGSGAFGQPINQNAVVWAQAPIPLALGDNNITARLSSGERILYLAHYNVQTSFADYPLQVDLLSFSLDQSKQGYLTTDATDFTLTGKASGSFYISTTKWELGSPPTDSSPMAVNVDENGAFQMPLSLEQGKGLYKVDVLTTVATPRGSLGYLDAGHFYVNLLSDGQ
ncbi:hypothetical protein N0M98_06895 [Paenibacillus doosanensis]|uniref:hypothetical protein n=1 Tax=Paenibacillus doosanensis TaxID=1229154 RepID=UPI0021802594|nr:hypothetical protein [Paenibacillus doosanensis]MCS7459866.1 hypothetical protein [Paenibacillus doosanensis]